MPDHPYTVLDVFTATPLEGNGLAVVHDADNLDDATMLAFARETRLAETTFVQRATRDAQNRGADYRNRIWTVAAELPFAGHPSLGTAAAIAYANGRDGTSHYVQETGAGLQPIDVDLALTDRRAHASMLQEPAVYGDEVDPATALEPLGLASQDADPDLPPQLVSTGIPQLIVPLRDRETVTRITPDWPAIERLARQVGAVTIYAAAHDPGTKTAHARSFPFDVGIGEDPATGSAAGPLCAYLATRTTSASVTITQGVEIGRPSRLEASMEGDRPRVGGDVVVIAEGTLHL